MKKIIVASILSIMMLANLFVSISAASTEYWVKDGKNTVFSVASEGNPRLNTFKFGKDKVLSLAAKKNQAITFQVHVGYSKDTANKNWTGFGNYRKGSQVYNDYILKYFRYNIKIYDGSGKLVVNKSAQTYNKTFTVKSTTNQNYKIVVNTYLYPCTNFNKTYNNYDLSPAMTAASYFSQWSLGYRVS